MNWLTKYGFDDGIFGDFFGVRGRSKWVKEDSGYVFTLEVPGIKKEDLDVQVENTSLSVKGKTGSRSIDFSTFWLEPLNVDDVKAQLVDGVLTINFPSKKKESKGKKVSVL